LRITDTTEEPSNRRDRRLARRQHQSADRVDFSRPYQIASKVRRPSGLAFLFGHRRKGFSRRRV
jgi:hypothetical protein